MAERQMPSVNFRKILVPTDFSESAAAALGRAASLAARTKAQVTVLHVLEHVAGAVPGTSFETHWSIPPAELKKAERKLRLQADERLAKWVAPYRPEIGKLRTETLVGVPFVETIRLARKDGCDLVVAGTQGRSGLKRLLLGSTAERLVRKCPCPVWVVKAEHEWPLRSILVPVDLTEVGGRCLQIAGGLARLWECAVTALYVFNFPAKREGMYPAPSPEQSAAEQRRTVRKAAADQLERFVDAHIPADVKCHRRLAVGRPWEVIDLTAKRLDAGLIIMGSLGRSGIPGFLIGNTAEKVLRTCDRSILAVKPEGFESPVK